MRKLLVLVLLLLAHEVEAACQRYNYRVVLSQTGQRIPQFIVCDTVAELPATNVADGDLAYSEDTDIMWSRAAGAWVDITSGGGGGAPTGAQYWVGAAHAGLSAEHDLSLIADALIRGTGGTPSAYGGDSCGGGGDYVRAISSVGVLSCNVVDFSELGGSAILAQLPDDATSGLCLLSGGGVGDPTYTACPTGSATHDLLSATHTDTDPSTPPLLGQLIYGGATGLWRTLTPNTSTTKKLLSMTGTGAGGWHPAWQLLTGADVFMAGDVDGNFDANDLDEAAVETELESVLDLAELQPSPTGDDQVFVSLGFGLGGLWKTLPACEDTAGAHLNYTVGTNTFSCGTSTGGGSTPTGTGFQHVTAGVEDAAAKLVDTADINADQVTYAKIQNVSATARLLGRASIGVGDIEEIGLTSPLNFQVGNLHLSTVPIADGGTGQTTQPAAFDALAPTTTQGDIIFHNGTDNVRLAKSTSTTNYLTNNGVNNNPAWDQVSLSTGVIGALPLTNGGTGQATQQAGINALTNVTAATNEHVLTKDTGTGNAIFKATGVAPSGDSATSFFSTGMLEVAIGGNGSAPGGDDQLLVSSSTLAPTWKTLTTCTGAGKALTYDVSSNTFGCNTISAGGGPVVLASNVAVAVNATYVTIFTITPTASKSNSLNFTIHHAASATTIGMQFRVRSADVGNAGFCSYTHYGINATASSNVGTFSNIISINSAPSDSGALASFATATNRVSIYCAFTSDGTPGDVILEAQLETGTTSANILAGSSYTYATN